MRGQSEPMGALPPRGTVAPPTPPMAKREGELIAEALHHVAAAIEALTYALVSSRG